MQYGSWGGGEGGLEDWGAVRGKDGEGGVSINLLR